MNNRASGILLHITSLPSPYGIGDLGPAAYRFVDFLLETRQRFWQILPLNPSGTYVGNSPYTSYSAFAGNPLLISPEVLVQEGFLREDEARSVPDFPATQVDFPGVVAYKGRIFSLAFDRWKPSAEHDHAFHAFCEESSGWLPDYSLYVALKEQFNDAAWYDWPADLRNRKEDALQAWREKLADAILAARFRQYIFFKQWSNLKGFCNSKKIEIIGDMPIYVSSDSVDLWSHPELFKLDEHKNPTFVSGAPPDYFSQTGQLWGTPVYDWEEIRKRGFSWWLSRIGQNLRLFDRVRLDHFRGFVAYWEVPADAETAVHGQWVNAPAMEFFRAVSEKYSSTRIIAEDLGVITPDVREVMNAFGFPGMKVLLFAFGGDVPSNPYVPHNYTPKALVYTGTHDNNTIQGWFQKEASEEEKKKLLAYIGRNNDTPEIHWELIRLAMSSVADTCILPMQDLLGLGEEGRMNRPQLSMGNWRWRLAPDQITEEVKRRLAHFTWMYGRD